MSHTTLRRAAPLVAALVLGAGISGLAAQERQRTDSAGAGVSPDSGQVENPPGYRGMERDTTIFPPDSAADSAVVSPDTIDTDSTAIPTDSTAIPSDSTSGTDKSKSKEWSQDSLAPPTPSSQDDSSSWSPSGGAGDSSSAPR